jgi:hypothetical protein
MSHGWSRRLRTHRTATGIAPRRARPGAGPCLVRARVDVWVEARSMPGPCVGTGQAFAKGLQEVGKARGVLGGHLALCARSRTGARRPASGPGVPAAVSLRSPAQAAARPAATSVAPAAPAAPPRWPAGPGWRLRRPHHQRRPAHGARGTAGRSALSPKRATRGAQRGRGAKGRSALSPQRATRGAQRGRSAPGRSALALRRCSRCRRLPPEASDADGHG